VGVTVLLVLLSHRISVSHMFHTFVLCLTVFVNCSRELAYTIVTCVTRNSIKSTGRIVCLVNTAYRGFLWMCM
jgi:hypothetical protein